MNYLNYQTVKKNSKYALVVSDSDKTIACNEKNLHQAGISTLIARNAEQALNLLVNKQVSYILIDACLSDVPCNELSRSLRVHIGDRYIPIIAIATIEDEEQLALSISSDCDDILFKPFTLMSLNRRIASLEQMFNLKKLYKESVNEQLLANRILNNALHERSLHFEEIELLSRSKAVFCGDLFLTARFPDGSLNVLLADFTGHGLSAAIGALPVADIFKTMTNKGFELDYILESINSKLYTLLPVNMFMACIVLNISKDLKQLQIWNGGMPDIYIREYATGNIAHKIESTHMPLGIDDSIQNKFEIKNLDIMSGDQIIVYTDGLTEALNAEDEMFGSHQFDQTFNENTEDRSIFGILVDTFNKFCGDVSPADDVTLASIPCTASLMKASDADIDITESTPITIKQDDDWCWYIEFSGTSYLKINPVPMVMSEINKISEHLVSTNKLFCIMSVLYNNVVDHHASENNTTGFSKSKTSNNIKDANDNYIRIGIKEVEHMGEPALLVRMEDSAKEIDHKLLKDCLNKRSEGISGTCEGEAPLVYELNTKSFNQRTGNRFEAIIYKILKQDSCNDE